MLDKSKLQLTVSWFDYNKQAIQSTIKNHLKKNTISNYLEIGSFEGYSTVSIADFLIDECKQNLKSIVCVDSWEGGEEHVEQGIDMRAVEKRFLHNIKYVTSVHTDLEITAEMGDSFKVLCQLQKVTYPSYQKYDMIYVDASHTAYDALTDLVLAWKLLKPGGLLIFDDYLWGDYINDEQHTPKLGFDSFARCFKEQFELAFAKQHQRQYQMHIRKF